MIWFFVASGLLCISLWGWLKARSRYNRALCTLVIHELARRRIEQLPDITGLDLAALLTTRVGIAIDPMNLYPLLRQLADDGLIVRTEVPDTNPIRLGRPRAVYGARA